MSWIDGLDGPTRLLALLLYGAGLRLLEALRQGPRDDAAGRGEPRPCQASRDDRSVFVADDEATARRYAHRADGAHGFYFHVMRTKLAKAGALGVMRDYPEQPDSELSTRRCTERLVIAGTPESVADQILAFRKEVGTFGTLLYTGHDWTDPSLARRSMELMANEVWPRIDRADVRPRESAC